MNMSQKLSHAYIITAKPEDAYAKALEIAQAMLCTGAGGLTKPCGMCRSCMKVKKGVHPDLIVVGRAADDKGKPKREIYVEQIREIVASAAIMPNEAEKKVYIIRDAGTMNASAQNALLKILEEPPYFVSFILLANNAAELLETVRSRCVSISLCGEEDLPPAQARERAEKYLDIAAAGARISLLSFANENGELSNAEMQDFVQSTILLLTDMLCGRLPDRKMGKQELLRLVALMQKTKEYLRFNVSTKHILGFLTVETIVK